MAHQSGTALIERDGREKCGVDGCAPRFRSKLGLRRLRSSKLAALCCLCRQRCEFTVSSGACALTILSYCYRFVSNFAFLAVVYFTLNFLTKYEERTIIAALVLTYSAMRVASALRLFHFYSRIERLEAEPRGMVSNVAETPTKRQAIREVSTLRHQGELKAYMDLLFLGLISLLCIAKIVGN